MSENKINKPLVYSAIGGFVLVIIWSFYRFYYLPKQIEQDVIAQPTPTPIQTETASDSAKLEM